MSKKRPVFYILVLSFLILCPGILTAQEKVFTPVLQTIEQYYTIFYKALGGDAPKPGYEVFEKALTGFFNLKTDNKIKNNLLTIIDFSVSSNKERMWVVDMDKMEVIHYTLVAHGRNTGEEYAKYFSNKPSSYQSSLGFFITDNTYYGKHGLSLYLEGVEPDVNDKARERSIVMHGADYVSKDYIRKNGRLGRSFGCPSVPMENHEKVISLLSGGACMYIHYPDEKYLGNSPMLAMETAITGLHIFLSEASLTFDIHPHILSTTTNY